jgi:hypothetical protein
VPAVPEIVLEKVEGESLNTAYGTSEIIRLSRMGRHVVHEIVSREYAIPGLTKLLTCKHNSFTFICKSLLTMPMLCALRGGDSCLAVFCWAGAAESLQRPSCCCSASGSCFLVVLLRIVLVCMGTLGCIFCAQDFERRVYLF